MYKKADKDFIAMIKKLPNCGNSVLTNEKIKEHFTNIKKKKDFSRKEAESKIILATIGAEDLSQLEKILKIKIQ